MEIGAQTVDAAFGKPHKEDRPEAMSQALRQETHSIR